MEKKFIIKDIKTKGNLKKIKTSSPAGEAKPGRAKKSFNTKLVKKKNVVFEQRERFEAEQQKMERFRNTSF